MLDARLRRVAELVRPGSRLADIGTDHAFLPVWLVRAGVCPRAIAADLREGPAAAARRTIREAGLEDRIEVRIGDGLAPVRPEEADDIVLAGMGGETIAAILAACPWAKNARYHWVMQPMTRPEALRRYLLGEGFSLLNERIAQDGERRYLVMEAAFTGEAAAVSSEAAYYIGALEPEEGAAHLRVQSDHLRRRAAGLRRQGDRDGALLLENTADEIDRYIREGDAG